MVHNGCGGLGAYAGGVVFDAFGSYEPMLKLCWRWRCSPCC